MSDYELTHELIILEDLGPPLSKSHDEWRYNCPNCEDKRGKPDKEGKMYFNIAKQKGWCFKCSTSFFVEPEGVDKDELAWDNIRNEVRSRFPLAIFEGMEAPQEVYFSFADLDSTHLKYLKNRNPYLPALKDILCIRGWNGKEKGVVLPFFYKNKICKYQTRFIDRKEGAKYFTSPGPKPLYSPLHIFNDFRLTTDEGHITICEGVFDAIALMIIGFPNPVAVLGDKLTPLQIYDIRSLAPIVTKAYICLDDWNRSLAVAKVIKKHAQGIQDTPIFCQWGGKKDDPEDFLRTMMRDPETKKEYSSRVFQIIEKAGK